MFVTMKGVKTTTPKKYLVRDRVRRILYGYPEARDNDNYLIGVFWYREMLKKRIDPLNISGVELLANLKLGELTSPESIRRSRQWINEHEPETRGKSYKARHGKAIQVVREIQQ